MMEALLDVVSPCPLLAGPVREGRVGFRILGRRKLPHGSQDILEIAGSRDGIDAYLMQLRTKVKVRVADRMQIGEDRALALLTIPRCLAPCDAVGSNAFLVSQETNGGSTYRWRLLVADGESLEAVLRKLREMRCDIRLVRVRRLRTSEILSSRQEAVVQAAWSLGYYDFPRKLRLTDLAAYLGLSKSALAQVLRRGEDKIIGRYYQGYTDRR